MAASEAIPSQSSIGGFNIKIPSEPCPLPSLGSDEESFVVLGHSLSVDSDDAPSSDDNLDRVGVSVVEEAKQLISNELKQLSLMEKAEQPSTMTESKTMTDGRDDVGEKVDNEDDGGCKVSGSGLPEMPKISNDLNMSGMISIATFPSDLAEDTQRKIREIIEENIYLKDKFLQNNMSIKNYYETIKDWQEDVQKVHQEHKEKIMEAKHYIEKLKKENYNLTQEREKIIDMLSKKDAQIVLLKNQLINQNRDVKNDEKLIKSTDDNLKEFELDVANKKLRDLEAVVQKLNADNLSLKEEVKSLGEEAAKVKDYAGLNENLTVDLRAAGEEAKELKAQLTAIKQSEDDRQKSMCEVIESLRLQLGAVTQRNVEQNNEELENVRKQLASTQIVLTETELTRAAAYAQLQAQMSESNALRKQIEESKCSQDENFALQTQLELYKSDFESEKNAKESIKAEKDRLVEDLQNLQRRNQQLQEEIELVRNNYDVVSSYRRSSGEASASSLPSVGDHFKCPKCSFGFRSLAALEQHVHRCLELDDQLP